ncbi:MAG: hypothetical protein WD058_03185 [Dehalococcoidia bacterium]
MPTLDELIREHDKLAQQYGELVQGQSPLQEVTRVNAAVDEIREVLKSTSGDLTDVKTKLGEHLDRLRDANQQIRDALDDPAVKAFTDGLSQGLDTAAKRVGAADEALQPVDQALDVLQKALEASDADASTQVQALADAIDAGAKRLAPLIERVPGLGVFFELWTRAIRVIAGDLAKIGAIQQGWQPIWESQRPGTLMYPGTATAEQRRAHEIRRLESRLAEVKDQMLALVREQRPQPDATPAIPDALIVVWAAERRAAHLIPPLKAPEGRALTEAKAELKQAEERLSETLGNYYAASDKAVVARVRLEGARPGTVDMARLESDLASALASHERAAGYLAEREVEHDAALQRHRDAEAAWHALFDAHREGVREEIRQLIPHSNKGQGFSDRDYHYLNLLYPQYHIDPNDRRQASATSEADAETAFAALIAEDRAHRQQVHLDATTAELDSWHETEAPDPFAALEDVEDVEDGEATAAGFGALVRDRTVQVVGGVVALVVAVALLAGTAGILGGGDGEEGVALPSDVAGGQIAGRQDSGGGPEGSATGAASAGDDQQPAGVAPQPQPTVEVVLGPIVAVAGQVVTEYVVALEQFPALETITFAWSGATCGTARSYVNRYAWDHREIVVGLSGGIFGNQELGRSGDCDHRADPTHGNPLVVAEVSGQSFSARCTFQGAGSGTGPHCDIAYLPAPAPAPDAPPPPPPRTPVPLATVPSNRTPLDEAIATTFAGGAEVPFRMFFSEGTCDPASFIQEDILHGDPSEDTMTLGSGRQAPTGPFPSDHHTVLQPPPPNVESFDITFALDEHGTLTFHGAYDFDGCAWSVAARAA